MPGILWRRWGTVRVKGKAEPQVVWEAFDQADVPDAAFVAAYERARDVFEREGPQRARPLFERADAARPGGDPPSQVHIRLCDDLAEGRGDAAERSLSVTK